MQVVSSVFTTIVKVKFNERRTNFKAYGIQIQRLLKLNEKRMEALNRVSIFKYNDC